MEKGYAYFFFAAFLVAGGCYEHTQGRSGDATETDAAVEDLRPDDLFVDDGSAEDPPPPDNPCPPVCADLPTGGEIGAACEGDATCDHAASCLVESVSSFNGELYFDYFEGSCILFGAGSEGCDPDQPASCPAGSRCIFMGEFMGQEYHGCFDACEPGNEAGYHYDHNCGCRTGYRCSFAHGVCLPGCSNDRECCERWWDLDGDNVRQPDEVVVKEGCTNVCDDAGLFDDTTPDPPPYCAASYACINDGDPDSTWGSPCEGDAWCPPDGRCLDEFGYADPSTGEPYIPGGYCIKEGCNYAGWGCAGHGGGCADLGTEGNPYYACLRTCRFGLEIGEPGYECRTTPGQEQVCVPVDPSFWYSPPPGGADGYCWPGNFPGGSRRIGESCRSDDDCDSPYGLGICIEWPGITMTPFCSVHCNEVAARDHALCGGDDGSGAAGGACYSGICWEACPFPDGFLGDNGCSDPEAMACYDTDWAGFGDEVYVGDGLGLPEGICIPRCTSDVWCSERWGSPLTCDAGSGVCR